EAGAAPAFGEVADGIVGVAESVFRFETSHLDVRMPHQFAGRPDAVGQRWQCVVVLERVAGRHQQPDPVEAESPQALQGHQAMALMGRIEAAAEEADAHAIGRQRQAGDVGIQLRRGTQGRVCPWPCTKYLNEQSCSSPTGPRAWNLPVAMPISPPKPNSPPSANCVEALCMTMAESTSERKRCTAAASSAMMASV